MEIILGVFAVTAAVIPFVIVLLVIGVATGQLIYIVDQQSEAIIERFGKFNRITSAGIHVKIPLIERIAKRVNLRTDQTDFKIDAKTKDNVTVGMNIAAQYHVSLDQGSTWQDCGVYRSYYMLVDPVSQMQSYLIDALRSAVPAYTLDEVFDKKDSIAADVNNTVSDLMINYGYNLVTTLITSIDLPKDVEQSMNRINSAQRELQAAQSLAEAERVKIVTEAKAKAESMEQAGVGIANQRKAIAAGIAESLETIKRSGVSTEEANQLFLFTQWTEMMGEFARAGSTSTVVLPSDFRESASMFDQMVTASNVTEHLDIH